MALEGSLKEFGLADILQLIYYQRKTGVLTVEAGFDRVKLLFYEGNIVFVESLKRGESRLGRLMIKKGLIKEDQLAAALEEQKTAGARLGNILLRMDAISKEDLKEALINQFTELVSYLFTWRQGRYDFRPEGIPIDKDVPISLDTQHILMEGLRVLDEWSQVEGKITLDSVFVRSAMSAPGQELTEDEEKVLSLIDGENDVSEVAELSGLDHFQASKALLAIFEKGIIEKKKKAPKEKLARAGAREYIPPMLLELAVVLIFVLSIVLFTSAAGKTEYKLKPFTASEELDNLRFAISVFFVEHGTYPKPEQLNAPLDPWGRPYNYSANDNRSFVLYSSGPEGNIY